MARTHENAKIMNEEMRHILDHACALVDATSGELDERIQTARAALKERLESAMGDCGELGERLLDKAQVADEFVHVKPYYAIGGTFVAGLLMGWFMSKK